MEISKPDSSTSPSLYLTTAEAAQRLGVTPELVRRLCQEEQLPGATQERENGPWRIPAEAVDQWLAQRQRQQRRQRIGGISIAAAVFFLAALFGFLNDGWGVWERIQGQQVESPPPLLPTPTALHRSFVYGVEVIDAATNQPILAAQVQIQIVGKAPLQGLTDNLGYTRINVPASHRAQPGRVVVAADGYFPYRQEIDIYLDQLPDTVRLRRDE